MVGRRKLSLACGAFGSLSIIIISHDHPSWKNSVIDRGCGWSEENRLWCFMLLAARPRTVLGSGVGAGRHEHLLCCQ